MSSFGANGALWSLWAIAFGLMTSISEASSEPAAGAVRPTMGKVVLSRLEPESAAAQALRIDGVLDEQAWSEATAFTDFRVIRPDTLSKPAYATKIMFLYTRAGLYVGADMEQPAEELVQRLTGRDALGISRDEFSLSLDMSGEGRYGYWMALALGDNAKDGVLLPERRYSTNWDGAWKGATAVTDRGWSAEYFIPWSQMAMPDAGAERTIAFFCARQYAKRDERWGYPALPRTRSRFMSDFQELSLRDINPRRQWSVFPYGSVTQDWVEGDALFKAGADLFFRPSSNLQATASINPDFGGVEADDVIVNLTAFEVFFPERRLFFLEGQEVFKVSPRSDRGNDTPVSVVNTRRIGGRVRRPSPVNGVELDVPSAELRQPAELLGALKLTGQAGGLRYGILGALENDVRFDIGADNVSQSGTDYAALRLLYETNDARGSRGVGVISTLATHPERDASVVGLDAHYLSGAGRVQIDSVLLGSDIDDAVYSSDNGTGIGGFVDVVYTPRQGARYRLGLSSFDSDFQLNDMGFLRRNDATTLNMDASWRGASALRWLRRYEYGATALQQWNGAGQTTDMSFGAEAELTLRSLWEVEASAFFMPGRYDDRNSFGNGTFKIQGRPEIGLEVRTNPADVFSFGGEAWFIGEDVGGRALGGGVSMNWRPAAPFNAQLEFSYQNRDGWLLHQSERNFTTFDADELSLQLSGDYFLSARQQLRLALQWVGIRSFEKSYYELARPDSKLTRVARPAGPSDDFAVSSLNLQLRYRWQIAPLSDLFIVYTRVGGDGQVDSGFGELFRDSLNNPVGDQLILKLRYRLGS